MKVELTSQEADELINLLDAACRAGGLLAATPAVRILTKIQQAAADSGDDVAMEADNAGDN